MGWWDWGGDDVLADGLGAAFEGGFLGTALDAWVGEGPGGCCWCLHRRVVEGVGVVVLDLVGGGRSVGCFWLRGENIFKGRKTSAEKVNAGRPSSFS